MSGNEKKEKPNPSVLGTVWIVANAATQDVVRPPELWQVSPQLGESHNVKKSCGSQKLIANQTAALVGVSVVLVGSWRGELWLQSKQPHKATRFKGAFIKHSYIFKMPSSLDQI